MRSNCENGWVPRISGLASLSKMMHLVNKNDASLASLMGFGSRQPWLDDSVLTCFVYPTNGVLFR